MGHVGKSNIYVSWPFVKVCLILNYLGQGAWLITNHNNTVLNTIKDLNPFFEMLPGQLRPFAVILSALAVHASQALINGSYFHCLWGYCKLDLMPHIKINYPPQLWARFYIPLLVNNIMWVGWRCTSLPELPEHMVPAYWSCNYRKPPCSWPQSCSTPTWLLSESAYGRPFHSFFSLVPSEAMFFFSSLH